MSMKIRSYKGPVLEPLYEAIRRELGPEAIVISAKAPEQKTSLLRSLTGGAQGYELIAVADDTSADLQLLQTAGINEARNGQPRQDRQLQEMQETLVSLQGELRDLTRKGVRATAGFKDAPEFACEWDPRFVERCGLKGASDNAMPPRAELLRRVAGQLRVQSSFRAGGNGPKLLVFAGPTGSGKTTTLAKLAARWCLTDKLKVGLITTDTFRVAAVDQIKEYATLLGLDLSVVFSAAEAARAARDHADKDLILVDTPGRNHYDQMSLAGIRGMLQGLGPVSVLLHVPATLDARHGAELLKNFGVLNPNALILTKMDETRHYGMLTTLACETECPIAFLTDGQRVPQDLHSADANMLAGLLLGEDVKDDAEIRPALAGR